MKISKQWLFALLACSLLGTGCLVAQTDESDAIQKKVPKRDREMRPGALPYGPGFSGDFFVGLSGGFNVLESAGDKAGSAGGRFSPAFNVYVGKWFTPSVGVRVGYSGLTARGWTTRTGNFTYGEPSDGVYKKRMGFTYLHGDVLWNISNLLGGYRSDRRWEFVPFVSAGWLHTNPRDRQGGEPDEFAMGAGLLNKIYLTDWLDLTLEARQLIFKERAVNPGTGGIAGMTSVTVGLDFNISSPDFSKWHPINRVRPGYSSFGKTGAARSSNRDENGKVIRGPYKTNKFFDNTFVSVGGGANFYSSTDDKGGSWMRQIAPAIDVNVGKWLRPDVGLRIGYSGLMVKGWSKQQTAYAPEPGPGGLSHKRFGISYLHGDVMWNISNTIGGYKEERFWDFVPYLSAGWVHSYALKGNEGHDNELGVGVGLLNVVRLSKRVDLTVEAKHMFVRNNISTSPRGGLAGLSTLTLGVAVNLGKTDFDRILRPELIWNLAGNRDSTGKIIRGPYKTNKFFDNFFVGAAGGIHVLESAGDGAGSAGGRISPALDIYVGKWMTPSIGVRIGYTGLTGRGWSATESPYAPATESVPYAEKFGIAYLHGDVLWNISNTIGGFKEERLWDFVPYLSAGWLHSYSVEGPKASDNELAVGVGLMNNIRLSKRVDLNLTVSQLLTQESISKSSNTGVLGMTSVTLGVSVNLGKTGFDRVRNLPEFAEVEPVVPMEDLAVDTLAKADSVAAVADSLAKVIRRVDTVVVEREVFAGTVSPGAVFFEIGQTTLSTRELFHLDFYIRNVIALDKDKVFTITGCADKETGYPARNQQLSELRVQYVYDLLKNKYNIPSERLIIKAIGAENNRFPYPELNRAVILE